MNKRKIIVCLIALLVMMAAATAGICFLDNASAKADIAKATSKANGIAVVNFDEGVENSDGKQVFFAKSIIDFPNENFFYTTYEDASNGLESGKYAGMIVVPATFSKNVESLNTVLEKSDIKYCISDKISDKKQKETLENIRNFGQNLEQDISYMYINDIMTEFHSAQDDSKKVMKNDLTDKEAIDSINGEGLVAMVEIPDLTVSANMGEMFDGSAYSEDNMNLAMAINEEYSDDLEKTNDNIEKAEGYFDKFIRILGDAIKNIKDKSDIAGDALSKGVYDVYEKLHEMIDTSNNSVEGIKEDLKTMSENSKVMAENYDLSVRKYNLEVKEKTLGEVDEAAQNVLRVIESPEGGYIEIYADGYKESGILITQSSNSKGFEIQGSVEELNKSISANVVNKFNYDTVSFNEVVYHRVSENEIVPIEVSENGVYRNLTFRDVISDTTLIDKMAVSANDIHYPEENDLKASVSKNVITPIEKRVAKWNDQVNESNKDIDTGHQDMTDKIDDLEWINDEESLFDKVNKINDNLSNFEEGVNTSNEGFMDYAGGVLDGTSNQISALMDNVTKAEEESEKAVASSVSGAKAVKDKTSEENQLMLKDFSELLPNTRLGTMEYTQAYDFISSPINLSDVSTDESSGVLGSVVAPDEENPVRSILMMAASFVMGMLIMLLGVILKHGFHKRFT